MPISPVAIAPFELHFLELAAVSVVPPMVRGVPVSPVYGDHHRRGRVHDDRCGGGVVHGDGGRGVMRHGSGIVHWSGGGVVGRCWGGVAMRRICGGRWIVRSTCSDDDDARVSVWTQTI